MRAYVKRFVEWGENTYYERQVIDEWRESTLQRGESSENINSEINQIPNGNSTNTSNITTAIDSNTNHCTHRRRRRRRSTATPTLSTLPPPPSLESNSIFDPIPPDVRQWHEDRIARNMITYVMYYHDESVVHKNEYRKKGWQSEEVKGLYPKSEGLGYNISDFMCAPFGYLRHNGRNVRVIHPIGGDSKKGQFWWDSEHFVAQCVAASQMHVDVWRLHTDRRKRLLRAVFPFDNAPCHRKRAEDALNVSKMNVNPGGQQPNNMRNGYWYDEFGTKQVQVMYFVTEKGNVGKGLLQVLNERRLVSFRKKLQIESFNYIDDGEVKTVQKGHTMNKELMQRLLEQQEDFVEDAKDCLVIHALKEHNRYNIDDFLPRFHCELNPKENVWRGMKQDFRLKQDFSRKTDMVMAIKIDQSMESISLHNMRRYIRTAMLFALEYHVGGGSAEVKRAVKDLKKSRKSHRGPSAVF